MVNFCVQRYNYVDHYIKLKYQDFRFGKELRILVVISVGGSNCVTVCNPYMYVRMYNLYSHAHILQLIMSKTKIKNGTSYVRMLINAVIKYLGRKYVFPMDSKEAATCNCACRSKERLLCN